jgi:heptosyltransferase III
MSTRRVLVIRGGAIGDFILTLPAIHLLRTNITDVHIEVMGNHGIVDLALASGHADAIHYLDSASMARMFGRNAPLDEQLCAWLRGFNLVVSYLFDPDGYFRSNMERAGVRTFLDAPHRVENSGLHAQQQLARPLERLAMWLEPDAAPIIRVDHTHPRRQEPLIAIHPGSGSLKKNWPIDHWCRLGKELLSRYPGSTLALVSGEAERARGVIETIQSAWQGQAWQHWESLPLVELARRLPACSCFLGHDSGITHLAAACAVPCHAFFGPTDPAVWAPRNAHVSIHRASDPDLTTVPYAVGSQAIWAAVDQAIQDETSA